MPKREVETRAVEALRTLQSGMDCPMTLSDYLLLAFALASIVGCILWGV